MGEGRRASWFRLNLLQFLVGIPTGRLVAQGHDAELLADPAYLTAQLTPRARASGLPGEIASFVASGREARERDELARRGLGWVCPEDEAWPVPLRTIEDPPLVLYHEGRLEGLPEPFVAVVGSRRSTPYGRQMAARVGRGLADSGATVVSGLARGIDGAAHGGALEGTDGATVAVLGCGLDQTYPPEHVDLRRRLVERGAVVAELPLGAPPLARHFPLRNRLIAGLCRATVVVEAGERSGSLITARLAAEQGREVLAVPGDVGRPGSRGTNALLQAGAGLVCGPEDVLSQLGLEGRRRRQPGTGQGRAAAAVLRLLRRGPATADALATEAGLGVESLARSLYELVLDGLIRREPGDVYVVVDP